MTDSPDISFFSSSPTIRRARSVAIDPFCVCLPASHILDTYLTGFPPSIRWLLSFTSTILVSIVWILPCLLPLLVGLSMLRDCDRRSRVGRVSARIHMGSKRGRCTRQNPMGTAPPRMVPSNVATHSSGCTGRVLPSVHRRIPPS